MPLEPKKVKWRRQHRGRRRGMATRGSHVSFGSFGLKTVEAGWVTARQIESARIAIIRQINEERYAAIVLRIEKIPRGPGFVWCHQVW